MAALHEVIAGLRHVLDRAAEGRRHLLRSLESLADARRHFATVLAGSADPDAESAPAHLAKAHATALAQVAALDRAVELVRDYLRSIAGDPTPPAERVPDERIDQVRANLRPGVRAAQTTGWWLRSDGSRVRLRSGPDSDPDGWEQQARRFLRETFPDERRSLYELSRHVEIQLAIRSHQQPFGHEVLVIDRKVCGRDPANRNWTYSCDKYLPAILAEGTTLTVVEHDGTRVTYVGRRADDDHR